MQRKAIEHIKKLNRNDVAFDEQGRLIIRMQDNKYNQNIVSLYDGRYENEIIANKLLHPEDRIVHKSLIQWANELMLALKSIESSADNIEQAERIAGIFNNAAFIFYSLNDVTAARELCYSQIQMFLNWGKQLRNNVYQKFVFQPWVNLIRIDRLEKNYEAALVKINILNPSAMAEMQVGATKVAVESLYDVLRDDEDIISLVTTCSLSETIKCMLANRQYESLIQFIEKNKRDIRKQHHALFDEAYAIAVANNGNINAALAVLEQARLSSNPAMMHIFSLRESEMLSRLGRKHEALIQLRILSRYVAQKFSYESINMNDINFGLHTVNVLRQMGNKREAIDLVYFCLLASEKIHDEMMKANCLVMLHEMISKEKGKRLIESMLREHYAATQYHVARKRMAKTYPDLYKLDNNVQAPTFHVLFEELLIFSNLLWM